MTRWVAAGSLSLALIGCVRFDGIGHQSTPVTVPVAVVDATFNAWPVRAWWTDYRDPMLNALITSALAESPDIRGAEGRLRAVQALTGFANSTLLPQVNAGFSSLWQRYSEHSLVPESLLGGRASDNSLAFNLNYEVDLFGKNHALRAAFMALTQSDQLNMQVARLAVSSAVARAYFKLGEACAQVDVLEATMSQRRRILELVKARVALGLDSTVELRQAEGALPQTQEALENLAEEVSLLRNTLNRLTLMPLEKTNQIHPRLTTIAPPQLPANIPADLIGHRPDVQAAKWQVEALLHGVDYVRAQFYPSVNLSAFAGFGAIGIGNLLTGGSHIYGINPAVTLPIFDAGRLRAELKFVNASTDFAIEHYNINVLDAMNEVINTVTSIRALAKRKAAQAQAQAAAEQAYSTALERFQAGLTGYLTVLSTETAVLEERRVATSLTARALELDVELKRALGGGADIAALPATK